MLMFKIDHLQKRVLVFISDFDTMDDLMLAHIIMGLISNNKSI